MHRSPADGGFMRAQSTPHNFLHGRLSGASMDSPNLSADMMDVSPMVDPQLLGGNASAQAQPQRIIDQLDIAESSMKSTENCLAIRPVDRKRASELAVLDDDNLSSSPDKFHFQCPAKSCGSAFDADVPYSTFVAHVGNHASELFTSGGFRNCYFECHKGFIDGLQ
jgi:hypothetical protein